MPRYKVELSYDGTHYSGWQLQPGARSIQGELKKALSTILQTEIHPVGAGRTDAGVHALQQFAHFDSENEIDLRRTHLSLNGLLDEDIRVLSLVESGSDFHARYSAKRKEYHYHITTAPTLSPFKRLYSVHLRYELNETLLREAASRFVGTHDFTTFGNKPRPSDKTPNPIRTINRLDIIETEDGYRFEFEGPGFLYKMVRNISGCLIEIARGKRSIDEIDDLFAARDRRALGIAAPARGLFLIKVGY